VSLRDSPGTFQAGGPDIPAARPLLKVLPQAVGIKIPRRENPSRADQS